MFQRIKASIDSKIAEEQAKSRFASGSPSRSASGARRNASRAISPTKRAARQGSRGRQDGSGKGPDPTDFEPEFVIDDEELSRSGTPKPLADQEDKAAVEVSAPQGGVITENGQGSQAKDGGLDSSSQSFELPTDVRVKLRKLEKLEGRYQELLRSYRIAHARVQTIESFETSLRENTPLTSISDPNALVEYINQVNLKGDMVLDELKRVSSERDSYKQRLDEAEKKTREAWDETAKLRTDQASSKETEAQGIRREDSITPVEDDEKELAEGDPPGATKKSPTTSIKTPTVTIPGMSLFSPRPKPLTSPKTGQASEDLFSYDGEIPRLEGELQAKQEKIRGLEADVQKLRSDLAVTRESTQSMVQTLEEATREVNLLRDSRDRAQADAKEQHDSLQKSSVQLRADLDAAEAELQQLKEKGPSDDTHRIVDINKQLEIANTELETFRAVSGQYEVKVKEVDEMREMVSRLEEQLSGAQADRERSESQLDVLRELVAMLRSEMKEAKAKKSGIASELEGSSKAFKDPERKHDISESSAKASVHDHSHTANTPDTTSASKKNKKKRKKGTNQDMGPLQGTMKTAKPMKNSSTDPGQASEAPDADTMERLRHELQQLQALLKEKDAAIENIHSNLKDQEALREEIESLRDELVVVGQEHVEAKDKVKELSMEKSSIEQTVMALEKELAEVRGAYANATARSEQKQKELAVQFEELKAKATTSQTDLSAAQQLASSRFKDLNALRNVLQKAQPEINTLRSEAAEMKSTKEALIKKEADFKRLDSRHEEMRFEVVKLKQTMNTREAEIKSLNQLNNQEASARSKAEDAYAKTQQEVIRLEAENRQAADSVDRVSEELRKVSEELATHKARLRDVEQQFSKHRSDSEGLKEEIELKSAQFASAQSLMASMRDQTAEMATQMKEARDRCESLDEEVADAHRLLSERSREGETMRRLLADVEGRADARTREMKERMDTAIEERDRAEEEASTVGRRRARELEDLRNKYRDLERSLKRAEEDKEELEIAQRDWKIRREELEYRLLQSRHEAEEVKKAMGELRDSLEESEKQARDLERQKAELRRSVQETQHRLEKLEKSNKSMADENSKVRENKARAMDSGTQSSRPSMESTARVRAPAPAPPGRTASGTRGEGANGQVHGAMDYVYLKNVLLQFLEQKDKKHQMQLIPVLGMLLHFDT
ncbi:MAG: hypothetical protein Q9217_004744 [Psora testacea]